MKGEGPTKSLENKAGRSVCAVRCRAQLFLDLWGPAHGSGEGKEGGLNGAPGPSPQSNHSNSTLSV